MSETDPNPHLPSKPAGESARTIACSFCGKSPTDGPLVQAPNQDVYICRRCARIAGREIDGSRQPSWFELGVSFFLGLSLTSLVALNWLSGDEAHIGWLWSLIGLVVGLLFLGHCAIASALRMWQPPVDR